MNREEIEKNIGVTVTLNNIRDLAFSGWLKPWINTERTLAYLKRDDGKYESVPPKNVEITM